MPRLPLDEEVDPRSLPIERKLAEKDAHHLIRVRRARQGEALEIADRAGRVFAAELKSDAVVKILREIKHSAPAACSTVLYQAPPKGGRLDDFIRPLSELGLTRLVPIETARSVVRPKDGWANHLKRWERRARESAKQSRRPVVLECSAGMTFADAVAEASQTSAERFLLVPPGGAQGGMEQLRDFSPRGQVALFVGPEGGFSEAEQVQARAADFIFLSINPHILRSETAGMAALAILQFLMLSTGCAGKISAQNHAV